jgi:uncharacterized protein (TIGR00297 family)
MVPVAFAVLLRWIPLWLAVLLAALAVIYGGFVSPRLFKRTLRADEMLLGFSPGKLIYGATVLVMLLVFRESGFHVVAGAWALMGVGDGMSNIIGRRFGRAKIAWNRAKSWEGFAAFVASGTVAAGLLVWWVSGRAEGPYLTLSRSMLVALAAAVPAGLIETLSNRWVDDNLTVPATGALALYLLTVAHPLDPTPALFLALALNFILGFASYRAGAVDDTGLVAGLAIGTVVALTLSLPGFLLLGLMFVLGTGATRWGYARKKAAGLAQEVGGARSWMNATAKCVVPVACGTLALFDPWFLSPLWKLGFVAALATAAMDTVSSELGPLYGRVTVLPPTLRRVRPGTEGAVSLEGTLLGLIAAAVVTEAGFGLGLIPALLWWVVMVAAFAGTTVESLLGACGLGKTPAASAWLNLVNTAVGAAVAMTIGGLL